MGRPDTLFKTSGCCKLGSLLFAGDKPYSVRGQARNVIGRRPLGLESPGGNGRTCTAGSRQNRLAVATRASPQCLFHPSTVVREDGHFIKQETEWTL